MTQPFELVTSSMNHRPEPEFQGIWYPYTGSRMKDCYDLRLKDGTELRGWYPNATAWSSRNKITQYDIGRVEDDDVAEIRLMTDDEIDEICYFGFTGPDRLDRNIRYFGDVLPKVIRNEDGTVTFERIVKRVFEDPVRSSWDGNIGWWLLTDELSEEELEKAVVVLDVNVEGFFKSLGKYFERAGMEGDFNITEATDPRVLRVLQNVYAHAKFAITTKREEEQKKQEQSRIHQATTVPKQRNRHRNHANKGTPKVSWDKPEKEVSSLTGKQRRKQEKKQRRIDREQNAKVVTE